MQEIIHMPHVNPELEQAYRRILLQSGAGLLLATDQIHQYRKKPSFSNKVIHSIPQPMYEYNINGVVIKARSKKDAKKQAARMKKTNKPK